MSPKEPSPRRHLHRRTRHRVLADWLHRFQPRLFTPPAASPTEIEIERQLTTIWERVLHTAPIGAHDDFFALGGDSLKAVRILAALERVTHRPLPLAALIDAPRRPTRPTPSRPGNAHGLAAPRRHATQRHPPAVLLRPRRPR